MAAPIDAPASADGPGLAYAYATPRTWAESLLSHARELIVDQAHLEKKAAAAAVTFLFRVPLEPRWQRGLSALAREELVHFERTLKLCAARGIEFVVQAPTDYASRLKKGSSGVMPDRLVDELLIGAIIEGRSCERMRLLAAAFAERDPELTKFYRDLVEAEARHEALYVDIARSIVPPAQLEAQWQRLARHEAEVLRALPWSARMHGGEPEPQD